jgi:uncharacterized membrane protein
MQEENLNQSPAEQTEPPVPNEQPAPSNNNNQEERKSLLDVLTQASNQPKVTQEEKLWSFIAYIPFLGAIIALVMKPHSEFIKLHGRQGLLLFLFFFFNIFIYLFPFIGAFLGIVIHMGLIVVIVFSMYQALIGNWWKIPILGDIAEMIPSDLFVKVTRNAMMGPAVDKIDEEQQGKTSDNQQEQQVVQPEQQIDENNQAAIEPVQEVKDESPVSEEEKQ